MQSHSGIVQAQHAQQRCRPCYDHMTALIHMIQVIYEQNEHHSENNTCSAEGFELILAGIVI